MEESVTMSKLSYDSIGVNFEKLRSENAALKAELAALKESKVVKFQLDPEQIHQITADCTAYADALSKCILDDSTYDPTDTLCIFFPERTADIKRIVINGREEPVEGLERLSLDVEALVDRPRVTVERRK